MCWNNVHGGIQKYPGLRRYAGFGGQVSRKMSEDEGLNMAGLKEDPGSSHIMPFSEQGRALAVEKKNAQEDQEGLAFHHISPKQQPQNMKK